MSETKWSPGPWKWSPKLPNEIYLPEKMASIRGVDENTARLISAAPDLYAALDRALDSIKDLDGGDPHTETGWASDELLEVWLAGFAALAKARGEQS